MTKPNEILDDFEELPNRKSNYNTRYKEYLSLTIKVAILFFGIVFLQVENYAIVTPIFGTTIGQGATFLFWGAIFMAFLKTKLNWGFSFLVSIGVIPLIGGVLSFVIEPMVGGFNVEPFNEWSKEALVVVMTAIVGYSLGLIVVLEFFYKKNKKRSSSN